MAVGLTASKIGRSQR